MNQVFYCIIFVISIKHFLCFNLNIFGVREGLKKMDEMMKNGYCRSSGKKYAKMVLFGLKTHFKKFFLGYFYPPTLPMQKSRVKMVPKGYCQPPVGGGASAPYRGH